MAVKAKPEGHHTITPYLVVQGAGELIDFLKRAFDATEVMRLDSPDGRVGHAELKIGDSLVMLGDAQGGFTPLHAMLHLYVDDCDAVYQRALAAGATVEREMANQFYGDRSGGVKDKWGNIWWVATHVEDVPQAEIERRAAEAMAKGGG